MVNRRASLLLAVALLAPARTVPAQVPAYRLGDVATQEVVTPVPLMIIDPERTAALQQREALKVPVVVRFQADAAADAEAALSHAFANARSNFLDALYRTMKGRPESERQIGGALFQRAVESARRRTDGFPLLDALAPVWARDESDADAQDDLAAKLRAVMERPIIAGKAPAIFNAKNSIRLVPVDVLTDQPTPETVEKSGTIVRGTQLASLAAARSELLHAFAREEQASARFLARFLTTNAWVDADLTQLLRTRRVEALCITESYAPAQVIVTQGQVVDAKTLAALNQLREKSLIGTLQTQLVQAKTATQQSRSRGRWLAGGAATLTLLCLLVLWRVRARRPMVGVPALAPAAAASVTQWQSRALAAEARVEQTQQAIRGGFLEWMRQRVVQGLFRQRAELLSAQEGAEAEMRSLEQRLEQLHAPLQERIAAYERRIAELEKELASKGEENRELIKAKILLAKHQLNAARERGEVGHFGRN